MADKGEEIDTSGMSAEEIMELQKQNCIFCKIAKKEIPAKIIHEDSTCICILDINPASEGHILVLPKEHYAILPHIPEPVQAKIFKTVKLMSHTLLKSMQCKGTTVFIANGAAAGQRAPHVLIHVFPRKDNDGLIPFDTKEFKDEEVKQITTALKQYLPQLFGMKPNEKIAEYSDVKDTKHKNSVNTLVDEADDEDSEDNAEDDLDDVNEEDYSENNTIKDIKNNTKKSDEHISKKKPAIKKEDKKSSSKKSVEKSSTEKSSAHNNSEKKKVSLDDISRLFG